MLDRTIYDRNMLTRIPLALVCLTLLMVWKSAPAHAFQGTKVILSPSTFSSKALQELQVVANQVAQMVDTLIPGIPPDYPAEGIICFEAPARWSTPDYAAKFSVSPVTISGPVVYSMNLQK
jgi:hypothetical protein